MPRYWGFALLALGILLAGLWFLPRPRPAESAPAPTAQRETLTINGSSTLAPAVALMARKFEQSHFVSVTLRTTSSRDGILATAAGITDVGMSSRKLTATETGLQTTVVGYDGLAIVVNADNAVTGLSSNQVRDIFAGTLANWTDVGGRNAPIICIARPEDAGEYSEFLEYFGLGKLGPGRVGDKNEAALLALENQPNAITFMSLGYAHAASVAGHSVRLLAIDGTAPTPENVAQATYPIVRPLLLLTRPNCSPQARAFIAFALSPQGQECLSQADLISTFSKNEHD